MYSRLLCVLFILCCLEFVYHVCALKAGDGVCTVKSSVRKTRNRYHTQAKLCGKKKCVVKVPKREVYWETIKRTVCCNGWEYKSDKDICIPHCSTGCLKGRCTAPNVCTCDPPSYLEPEHRNACIEPICQPACFNAVCAANNTCHCMKNFTSFNATHCFHCDAGYSLDSTLKCVPKCEKKCENGTCTAPNVCTCLPGFSKQGKSDDCKPVCEKCVNSNCTGPNKCSCWDDYTQVNSTHCVPNCDDCDDVCVSPNNCTCDIGYEKVNGTCSPVCDEMCINAVCTQPNVCSCYDGYIRKNGSSNNCYKPCDSNCTGTCNELGECIEKHCFFTYNTKKYNKFRKQETFVNQKIFCCANWNYVHTIDGCVKAINDRPADLPICKEPCINGKCIKNDVCECNTGFRSLNNTHCARGCPLHFINDLHTLNCTCDTGYTLDPANDTNCLPVCENGCENGVCVAPNKCECPTGYDLIDKSTCKPNCSNCDNGECISPNNCVCNEGYAMNNSICTPVCHNDCVNGVCVAPDECECHKGYRRNSTAQYVCYKPCSTLCNYGTCNIEGQCICGLGWELDGDTCKAVMPEEVNEPTGLTSQTTLAGLELSWVLSGVVIILLVALAVIIMQRIWQRRKKIERKVSVDGNAYGSVVYTVPNTLTRRVSDENVVNDKLDTENICDTTSEYENVEDEAQVRERLFKIGNQF